MRCVFRGNPHRIAPGTLSVLLHRVWQGGAGLVTLACIAHFLTPVEQGVYYTFASFASSYIVLDMGLSVVLLQVAAHEFCGLSWGARGEVVGGAPEGFLCLTRKAVFWYAVAALVFLLAYPVGLVFLDVPNLELGYAWQTPWLALVLVTAASMLSLPFLAIVEGTGAIVEVYGIRLIQAVLGSSAVWFTLYHGGGLYAVIMIPAASVLVVWSWMFTRHRAFLGQVFTSVCRRFRWRREVWPMQWRLGVSWVSGYLLMQIHTPLLFRFRGAVVAGQMGLTLTVANMIGLLAMAGMTSATPSLARAAAEGDWPGLDRGFRRAAFFSALAYLAGGAVFLLVRAALIRTDYGERFLPLPVCGLLVAAVFAAHLIGLLAVYLRAHRREPFMVLSVASAALTVAGVLLVIRGTGAVGVVSVMLAVNFLFGLPTAVFLWWRLRRQWHFNKD